MQKILPEKNHYNKKFLIILGVFICFGLPATSFTLIKFYQYQPAKAQQNVLSPLSSPLKDNQEMVEKSEQIYNLEYYLHLTKSFLNKATRLANDNPQQTELDKVKIINALNEALKTSNEAVKYYPQKPEVYLLRAQVYQKIKHIWPEGDKKAQQDIATANKLLNQKTIEVPQEDKAQPEAYIPTQKANLASNIIIAEPKDSNQQPATSNQLDTNADSGIAILEAGHTELIIYSNFVTNTGQIYLLPKGGADNHVLSIKSKRESEWFRVEINSPSDKDIVFNWWIIN